MGKPIRRAAVIGAGVMGSGIAAHFANAGVRVLLMDIVPPNLTEAEKKNRAARNRFAAGGLEKAIKAKPAAFFSKERARLVTVGNTEDDFDKLKDVDLVIEAIIEQLEPKRALFERLEKVVSPECIVASNTSGLRIADMVKGRSEAFRSRFLVMHFFNPVRYMKLLEIVAGPETSKATLDRVSRFGDELGKGLVFGKDTPNFVGNRIGCHGMLATIHLMLEEGLAPEDVDAIAGEPAGHPKSAMFRTADLVGVDTFVHVADNCYAALAGDEDREVFKVPAFIKAMVEKKLLGDKTKGGFYRKGKDGKVETLDPKTLEYRPRGGDPEIKKVCKEISELEDPKERIRKLVADPGKTGKFAWKMISRGLAYSARRVGEITDDIAAIDDAMRWGYNFDLGPFEVWDALGFEAVVDRMKKEGFALPPSIDKMRASGAKSFYTTDGRVYDLVKGEYRQRPSDPRSVPLTVIRKGSGPVLKNESAEAWDLGDGVLGLTFKSKANSIDEHIIQMINDATARAESDFRAMVIANQGEYFCVGANLFLIVTAAMQKQWDELRKTVASMQNALQRMKYASVPVVAAPYNMTLGGGLEVCLGAGAVQASAETYAGLVEVAVGLLPGGGGNMNLLWRALENVPEGQTVNSYDVVTQVFKNVGMARVATSAEEAQTFGYFRRTDGISFDKARLVTDAKARAIGLAESGWHAPAPKAYVLPGESGIASLGMMLHTLVAAGQASEHDAKIGKKVAEVLCGGMSGASHEVTEDEMLELEREAFISLAGEPKSQERMQYMLMNNKPLRN